MFNTELPKYKFWYNNIRQGGVLDLELIECIVNFIGSRFIS